MFGEIDVKDKWHQDRWGKFTASKISSLLTPGKGEMFSAGAWTYIEEKAIERQTIMWENPKLEFVQPLLWGKRYEEPAFDHYQKLTRNTSMRYLGTDQPLFLRYEDGEDAGGSPDAIMGYQSTVDWLLEIKCPATSKAHWLYLKMKNQWDLKKIRPEYYAQIQFLLMITKARGAHFASFDERFKDVRKRMVIIEVKLEQKFADDLDIRIAQASVERDRIIQLQSQN